MRRAGSPRALLARGDAVGVVATGFAVRRALLETGVRRLERMGYRVRLGRHVLDRTGYLAGDDDARAEDLRALIVDPEVRAIWFARGGYGTARILDRVPWAALKRQSKLLIGYSDLTALFGPAVDRAGALCLYGPVVTELGDAGAFHAPSLRALLAGNPVDLPIRRRQVLAAGKARGRLLGGNLTVLAHLFGTRFAPDLRGSVLFLEDVGEEAYRVDRALTQLRQSGAFRDLAGVLLGGFSVPARHRFPPDRPLTELIVEAFGDLGVPVVRDLPAGHVRAKRTLPFGGTAEIDTVGGRLRLRP